MENLIKQIIEQANNISSHLANDRNEAVAEVTEALADTVIALQGKVEVYSLKAELKKLRAENQSLTQKLAEYEAEGE